MRLLDVTGLLEHLGVEPADNRPAAARPQRIVGIEAELRVMSAEAGIHEAVLLRLRIEIVFEIGGGDF